MIEVGPTAHLLDHEIGYNDRGTIGGSSGRATEAARHALPGRTASFCLGRPPSEFRGEIASADGDFGNLHTGADRDADTITATDAHSAISEIALRIHRGVVGTGAFDAAG